MWEKKNTWAVGGLREIGFKNGSDLLMVLSSNGRGLFDCLNNKKLDRDPADYYIDFWNSSTGIVHGIGIIDDIPVKSGGFESPDPIRKQTDNWIVEVENRFRPSWLKKKLKADVMFLRNKSTGEAIEVGTFYYGVDRGYGFSDTGMSFVIATSSDLTIWTRQHTSPNIAPSSTGAEEVQGKSLRS